MTLVFICFPKLAACYCFRHKKTMTSVILASASCRIRTCWDFSASFHLHICPKISRGLRQRIPLLKRNKRYSKISEGTYDCSNSRSETYAVEYILGSRCGSRSITYFDVRHTVDFEFSMAWKRRQRNFLKSFRCIQRLRYLLLFHRSFLFHFGHFILRFVLWIRVLMLVLQVSI